MVQKLKFQEEWKRKEETKRRKQKGIIPGKIQTAAAKSLQSCPTLCDPTDGSPPGSPIPGIFQIRTLEWVAISFSNAWKWKVKMKSLSRVQLLVTPWTAAYQAPSFRLEGNKFLVWKSLWETEIRSGKETQQFFKAFRCYWIIYTRYSIENLKMN